MLANLIGVNQLHPCPENFCDTFWRSMAPIPSAMLEANQTGHRSASLVRRGSVLDCGSPLPLCIRRPGDAKAPEDWRTPKPRGHFNPLWNMQPQFLIESPQAHFSFRVFCVFRG
jgi:hypothetical protein